MPAPSSVRPSLDERGGTRPRAESGNHRPVSAPHSGTPSGTRSRAVSNLITTPEGQPLKTGPSPKPGHQRFVLTDPVAFRYLAEDPSTTVLEPHGTLQGYECYIVEQWTTSRTHPTFVITTYTGNETNHVIVGVLSVPVDEATWSPRLRVYFKAINQYHARRQATPLGILMVTNLSSFPSSLTVIPVPDGNVRQHRHAFFVNENLKRLGCSGRVGLTLQPPSASTISKFHQLYRTSEKNPADTAVIELVKLCQSALMLFAKLEIDYADGLLCDVTERALTDWWVEIGTDIYHVEPHDGILGPTTVAGLLGLLMGARNRLHTVGAPVAKDPFDVDAMKKGISYFQKQQRLPRSRRLDRRTLERLHRVTVRAAEHEGWKVLPKVLKNTAVELSGKGGEMLSEAFLGGVRERAGIAEIETCDVERFAELVFGERGRWLWRGKRKGGKRGSGGQVVEGKARGGVDESREEPVSALGGRGLVFRHDEQGGFTWTARKSTADGMPPHPPLPPAQEDREWGDEVGSPAESDDQEDQQQQQQSTKPGLIKRAADLPRQGLGKFKGAVGLKTNHQHKISSSTAMDNVSPVTPTTPSRDDLAIGGNGGRKRPMFRRAHSSPLSSPEAASPKSPTVIDERLEIVKERPRDRSGTVNSRYGDASSRAIFPMRFPDDDNGAEASRGSFDIPRPGVARIREQTGDDGGGEKAAGDSSGAASEQPSVTVTADPSVAGSVYNGLGQNENLPRGPEMEKDATLLLRRTLSLSHFSTVRIEQKSDDAYPRHLSFSLAEESVLTWPSITEEEDSVYRTLTSQLAHHTLLATESQSLHSTLTHLKDNTSPWTTTQLTTLDSLLSQVDHDALLLQQNYYDPLFARVQAVHHTAETLLRGEKDRAEQGKGEVEMLGAKLEYEIAGLRGRMEDVEAGVRDFRVGVEGVEGRVEELLREGEKGRGRCGVM